MRTRPTLIILAMAVTSFAVAITAQAQTPTTRPATTHPAATRPALKAAPPAIKVVEPKLNATRLPATALPPALSIPYERYLDAVLGGWIGKSIGGAVGARYEGYKGWVEVTADKMWPDKLPPNDDLDLQVLWLKVLEEKGAATTSDDLATAWLDGCWYPFNEYGIFRRNWRLGIHPPASGRFTNQFWDTGMGCPIRSEIWGYVFPGAPTLAARYAEIDGCLDHSEQSIGAEKMFAAMESMAFFVPDASGLAKMFMHYLPEGTPIARMTRIAFECHEQGLPLRDARDRIMLAEGFPESCDAQANVPFTFLALLYGGGDMEKTVLSAISCGYDTDCTAATSAAILGQILGATRIPAPLKQRIADELVMGIKYRRQEMTLSALARDTARIGILLAREQNTGVAITGTPDLKPLPASAGPAGVTIRSEYVSLPAAAPGDAVTVVLHVEGKLPQPARLSVEGPAGWSVVPAAANVDDLHRAVRLTLQAPTTVTEWPMRNLFTARLEGVPAASYTFGVAGAGLWKFLGVYYDALPDERNPVQASRRFNQHFVSLAKPYLPQQKLEVEHLYETWSRKLGRPALIPSYEHEIDLTRVVGLRGPCCAYLARTILSPSERSVYLMIGNNDGYRVYLNGEKVGEMDESTFWCPFNAAHKVKLHAGPNEVVLKLLRRSDDLKFTFGIRQDTGACNGNFNCEDWAVDLSDAVK